MIAFDELKTLRDMDINLYDKNDVKDIHDFKIDQDLKVNEKIESFLKEFNNPYCYTCNNVIVKIEYANTSTTLENVVSTFLIRKKQE